MKQAYEPDDGPLTEEQVEQILYSVSVEQMKRRSDVLLTALVGKELVEKWWESGNKAFDLKTPYEQWQIDPTVVYNYLMTHAQR